MTTSRDNAPLLVLRGVSVREDEHGNVCLNDLWTLAGGPENRRPVDWRRSTRATALEAALNDRMVENLHHSGASARETYRTTGKGRGSRTFAHPVLALDYAEYLEPALAVEMREIFLRYRAADISLANDILDRIIGQVREYEMRVHIRGEITARNRDLAGEGKKSRLQRMGVRGAAQCRVSRTLQRAR
ncbi:MAG: KilA-N domain-containing protein [Hyphomicrobiaceae bacterium]